MSKTKIFSINQPWAITIIYLIVGINWIFFSDRIISNIFSDNMREMSRFQLIKGCIYVLITSLLLYYMIRKLYIRINRGRRDMELLFTNPNLGMFKIDENGNFTYISNNIHEITGYSKQEIIGKNFMDFTPLEHIEEDQEKFLKIVQLSSENGFKLKKYLQGKEGNTIIIQSYGIATKNKKGNTVGYVAAFQNITEQETFLQSLEAKNKQLQELAADQSHLVRAPLARILGIIELIQHIELESSEKIKLIKNLKTSGQELDEALKDMSQKMGTETSMD